MKRLAIVLSHPVQYYSPLFKYIAKHLDLKVFYAFKPTKQQQGRQGFKKAFEWDIDLFDGYEFEIMENVSAKPGTDHFKGCDTPHIHEHLDQYAPTHILLFGWHLKTYRQALKYAKRKGIAVGVRGDSQFNPEQSWVKRTIKSLYYPFFLKQFNCFLSVGIRNKQYLQKYGVADGKIIFSPHAVDQEFWKAKKDLSSSACNLLWVAKFIDKKRPFDVINAFKALKLKGNNDLQLRMVGTGPLLEASKALAAAVPDIEFLGFKNQQELVEEYQRADLLILSSDHRETWGLVVNEAFSAKVPAIVSDACGCSEDLLDGWSGVKYEYKNVEDLSRKIEEFSNSLKKTSNHEQTQKSIEKMNKIYSFQSNVDAFKTFVEEF